MTCLSQKKKLEKTNRTLEEEKKDKDVAESTVSTLKKFILLNKTVLWSTSNSWSKTIVRRYLLSFHHLYLDNRSENWENA